MLKTNFDKDYTIFYKINHIIIGCLLGILNGTFLIAGIMFIFLYQLIQLIFNFRFFFYGSKKIKKGNSLKHTINKLIDYLIGFLIINFFLKYN